MVACSRLPFGRPSLRIMSPSFRGPGGRRLVRRAAGKGESIAGPGALAPRPDSLIPFQRGAGGRRATHPGVGGRPCSPASKGRLMAARPRSLVTTPLARHRPGARRRPHLGHRRRVRRQLEPVARRRHRHAQGRVDHRARQPQPVRRLRAVVLRALPRRLRLPHRLQRPVPLDRPRPRGELDQERRRPHLDVQDPPGGQVERRGAAHGQGHRLQLHVPEEARPHGLPLVAGRHQDASPPPTTRPSSSPASAPRPTSSRCGCRSCRSTSGASSRPYDEATKYLNSPPVVGSGPFQIVEWQKGKFIRCVANKDYWGGKPKVDQLVFQMYTNQDTLAQDLKLGTIDLAIDIPPGSGQGPAGRRRPRVAALRAEGLRLPVLQLLHGPVTGQPGPPRREVPPGAQLGGRQGQARRPGLPGLRRPGDVGVRGQLLRPRPRLALGAAGGRQVHVRPGEGQAGARRRRLQGHRRRRHPQRPQQRRQEHQAPPLVARRSRRRARSWASSSPAGGRTWASTSSTPSRTTACSPTRSTTPSARPTSRTTTSTSGRGSPAVPTPAGASATSAPSRSRTRTTAAGPTSSTTRCGSSSRASSTRRRASRSSTRWSRCCTSSRRTSCSRIPRRCRRGTRRSGRAGSASRSPTAPSPTSATTSATTSTWRPRTAETATTSSGGSNTTLIIIVVAVVVVVVAIVLAAPAAQAEG